MEQENAYFYVEKNHHNIFESSLNEVDCLSDKNFFHELSEYIRSVD